MHELIKNPTDCIIKSIPGYISKIAFHALFALSTCIY